jgi:hypothetical protein
MAELRWEHLFVCLSWVISFSSLSPLAILITSSCGISGEAFGYSINVGCKIKWGTEMNIWDQFFTSRPVASGSISACSTSLLINALWPNFLGCIFVNVDWMAEISSE